MYLKLTEAKRNVQVLFIAFLNTKIKSKKEDPDERWITTWNNHLL